MKTRVTDTIQSKNYVQNHVCRNDYYEKGKTIEGRWIGEACKEFGVEKGTVGQPEDWKALQENKHARTGEQLTVRHNTTRMETYVDKHGDLQEREVSNRKDFADMTTGAPKTVSVGVVVFKSQLIRECYQRAHQKLVREAEALIGRQAHNGQDHIYRTGNICALDYEHTTNRCLEPQLHDHVLIVNATQDPKDGKNYAIEFGELAKQSPYLTAVGADALAYELHAIGAETEPDQFGMPQIVAFRGLAEIYSERTKQIEALIEEIEEYAGTKLSNREAKTITLASRGFRIADFKALWERNKDELEGLATLDPEKAEQARRKILERFTAIVRKCSDNDLVHTSAAEIEAGQQALLSPEQRERGLAYVAGLKPVEIDDRSRELAAHVDFAIEHVFANQSVVKEYELWEEILLHAQGQNADLEYMKALVRSDPGLVFGQGREVGPCEHYRRELEMLLWTQEGKGRGLSLSAKDLKAELNQSQRKAVKELLGCRDQFAMLHGKAGVGKTYCLAEITRINLAAGCKVFVLAPENGAREVLHEDARKIDHAATADVFKHAENLDEFLVNARLRKGFGPGDLVIMDEAAMASLERMNAFQRLAHEKGFRVLLAGDDGQLNSIAAGDAFRILRQHSRIHISELTEIIRQTPKALEGAYLRATKLFGRKKIREGMYELYKAGVIKAIKGKDRIEHYAKRVMESLDGTTPAVMCNISHRENDAISEIVRAKRKELGQLTDERTLNVHRTLGWTPAQKREIEKIKPGHILQVTRGPDKGRAWKVLEVAEGKALTEDVSGQRRSFEKQHAYMIDVCEERELKVAIGDHLRTHSGGAGRDKGKEIINGELFIVAGWDAAGNPVDSSGKALTVRNLSYGYVGTVRKVQGSTREKNIFGLDRKSIRAATREIVNVACTRGRNAIEILVESIADIAQIENKSSHRKAVFEMTVSGAELPAEIRDLKAKIEQAREGASSTDKRRQNKQMEVDLQPGKQVGRPALDMIAAQMAAAAKHSHGHPPEPRKEKMEDRHKERR